MRLIEFAREFINVPKLHEDLKDSFLKYNYFTQKNNSLKIFFSEDLTQDDIDQVTVFINNFVEYSVFDEYVANTQLRQKEGFDLFQDIYADLTIEDTFSTVDDSIAGYDVLIRLRCMLKDGSGKTALRYLVKHIGDNGIFPLEQYQKIRGWIRGYCYKHRISIYSSLDRGQYDAVLDAVENSVSI